MPVLYSILLLLLGYASHAQTPPAFDLDRPEDNLAAFVKMRASLNPEDETVYYWTGRIYSYIPGQRSRPLFDMEAYNIARIVEIEGGYQMLTREVAIYRDVETGAILEQWYNPFISDTVKVIHVWNDPVNQQLMLKGRFGDWGVPYARLGNGRVCMYSDIFLLYPSPLKVAEYPENSRSDQYQAAELFQFFVDEAELADTAKAGVYSEVSWTRMSDFLPWMRMADRPGYLVYQCRGYKLMHGAFEALPAGLRDYVSRHNPAFMHAPDRFTSPNMTSWRYFQELQQGKQE